MDRTAVSGTAGLGSIPSGCIFILSGRHQSPRHFRFSTPCFSCRFRMKPTTQLAVAHTNQGDVITLLTHDGSYRIQHGRFTLHSSSLADAEHFHGRTATEPFLHCRNPRILVGGLGLGYTVQSILATLGKRRAEVMLAEASDEIVTWQSKHLYGHHGRGCLLDDKRIEVHDQSIEEMIWKGGDWHSILIQTSGSPRDEPSCSAATLSAAYQNLRPGGLLCVLAPVRDKGLEKTLVSCGFNVRSQPVKASEKARKPRFLSFWKAKKPGDALS